MPDHVRCDKPSGVPLPIEIRPTGAIDLATRDALIEAAKSALRISTTLEINAEAIEFIDASGIGALVAIERLAEARRGSLRVTKRSDALRWVLDLCGLADQWR